MGHEGGHNFFVRIRALRGEDWEFVDGGWVGVSKVHWLLTGMGATLPLISLPRQSAVTVFSFPARDHGT